MTGQKRLPPIFGLGLTAVLVFLVLPNPLRVPQNNPAAQAEYAPVPGEQDDATNANFGETGQATSGGIGAGGLGQGGPLDPPPDPGDLDPPPPRQKTCYGEYPKLTQTPDPLSPPCVAYFDGDNGGTTYQGVTKDTITVVLYNDLSVKGDMTTPWNISQEDPSHEASVNGQQTYLVRTIKAMYNYFQNKYQTYNRRVHLIAVPSKSGITSECSERTADAAVIQRDHKPFAVVHFGDGGQCFLNEMGKYNVPGFGLNSDVPRDQFLVEEGLVWGFFPDQETMSAWSASFICRKLEGRKARFAGEARLRNLERKFALIYPETSQRGPESAQLAGKLVKDLRARCNMKPDANGNSNFIIKTYKESGNTQANSIMIDLYRKDVTTIICYCVPVGTEYTVTTMQSAATGLNFFPEWYWDHTSRMFRAMWNREYGNKAHASFGTSYHWRNDRYENQSWYKAFKEVDPSGTPNMRFGFDIYHLFLNLYQGIQGGGPMLNPDSIKRGMFTFKYVEKGDFFRPYGGYGSDHVNAVSTYTFIDTGFAWWWDPTGTPPGETQPNGCLRAVRQGMRFHDGTWPEGDDDLFLPENGGGNKELRSPCFQDDTKLVKAGSSGF